MTARFRIGIDLGGTKIEAAAVDPLGAVRIRRRIATPTGNYRATIEAIAALVAAIEQQIGETASVGIGMPGTISPITGLVKNANSTWLIDRHCSAISSPCSGDRSAWPTTLIALLYRKQPTAPPQAWRPSSASFSAPGWEGASP
jgi:hypothetical protein